MLKAIERLLVLLDGHASAVEALQTIADSLRHGGRQIALVHGLPEHVANACREVVVKGREDAESALQALEDAMASRSLQEWRAKQMPSSSEFIVITPKPDRPRLHDAAAEAEFQRGKFLDLR
jgi:hypothetical protein